MKQPTYSIVIDDKDITSNFDKRLISMQITDNRGLEADTISIELDDSDGALELPKHGVNIKVSLGWMDDSVVLQNIFTIDECEHSGTPDRLSIRGQSANMRDSLNIKREQSYESITIEQMADQIAKRHNLKYKVAAELANLTIDHADQTQESDASFLTRILNDYDAIATIKNGMLIIFLSGAAKTASGQTLPSITINRSLGDNHTLEWQHIFKQKN